MRHPRLVILALAVVLTLPAGLALPAGVHAGDTEPPSADSFTLEVGANQTVAVPVPDVIPNVQYQRFLVAGELSMGPMDVEAALSVQNDGKYGEPVEGFWGGFSSMLQSGGVVLSALPLTVRVGRFTHSDLVDSPYSLFVSSMPISIPLLELDLSSERFFFNTRWLGLNRNSRLPEITEDRGANVRTYGVRFDSLRIGYQDVLVYSGRQFDLEYLLNPLPGILIQYAKVGRDTPWSEAGNDNSIMGFFADYTDPALYAYGQLLVDDINANAILNPDSYQNPNKIAWSLGGSLPTNLGVFGFYHAGATKYTFQAFGGISGDEATDTKYGYTYYPATEYTVDGESRIITPEDNYIGYLHGENNVAFMVDYQQVFEPVLVTASLEYTLSGSKSPANPWHQLRHYSEPPDGGEGTRFLDDEYLESRLELTARADAPLGIWSVFAEVSAGFVVNELVLTDIPAEYATVNNVIPYFAPSNSPARFIGGITIGGSVSLGL